MDPITIEFSLRLALALGLGAILGTERIIAHKSAGIRTYALISMGAALFVIISDQALKQYLLLGVTGVQPTYVLAQIVVAIGFLTGGLFLNKWVNYCKWTLDNCRYWVSCRIRALLSSNIRNRTHSIYIHCTLDV
jgi:uncharacterized membrane protein YhiD involved in acid resistance